MKRAGTQPHHPVAGDAARAGMQLLSSRRTRRLIQPDRQHLAGDEGRSSEARRNSDR